MTSATVWEFKRGRTWPALFVLVALLAIPGRASATVLTYVPSGNPAGANDLADLDHHYYYAWTIGLISVPAGESLSKAYVTFTNMYNWDATKNVLWLDLFDKPSAGGTILGTPGQFVTANGGANADTYNTTVRYAADPDVPSGSSPVTNLFDAFDSANALTTPGKTDLSAHSFMADGGDPLNAVQMSAFQTMLSTPDPAYLVQTSGAPATFLPGSYAANVGQWSVVQNGTGKFDYTYTFTAAQLSTLGAYISSDGNRDITLAFDPDCHFFNDGVSFTIETGTQVGGAAAVPEPASLMLLGTGLLLTANQYRRRHVKKAAK